MSKCMEMGKRYSTMYLFLAAAGAAAGIFLVRRTRTPSVSRILDRCEQATEALEHRLCWLNGLSATESPATK
jgi:hypothetical protein